jgi:hypothetical protein
MRGQRRRRHLQSSKALTPHAGTAGSPHAAPADGRSSRAGNGPATARRDASSGRNAPDARKRRLRPQNDRALRLAPVRLR